LNQGQFFGRRLSTTVVGFDAAAADPPALAAVTTTRMVEPIADPVSL
jgi:hypothetical protein